MKWFKPLLTILLGAFLFAFTGCASTGSSTTKNQGNQRKISNKQNLSLEDYLRRLSGVRVVGTTVFIRSSMSLTDTKQQPLFVVDGQKVGRSLAAAKEVVTKGKIKSVKAIPSSQASQYGMQGGAGVIVIETE